MKKISKYLLIFVFTFLFCVVNVSADLGGGPIIDDHFDVSFEETNDYMAFEDIPNNSYIIGTHLFTRNTNAKYKGILTTKFIMLGSTTIYDEDNLIIYYKNSSGKLIDGLSGEELPEQDYFYILHVDAYDRIYNVSNLTFTKYFGYGERYDCFGLTCGNRVSVSTKIYDDYDVDFEVWYTDDPNNEWTDEEGNGGYTQADSYFESRPIDDDYWLGTEYFIDTSIPKEKTYYYITRFVKYYENDVLYSDFTAPVKLENLTIKLDNFEYYYDADGNKIINFEIDSISDVYSGIELFYAVGDDNYFNSVKKYDLKTQFNENDEYYIAKILDEITYTVPAGQVYRFYVKPYTVAGEYGVQSNTITIDNTKLDILSASLQDIDDAGAHYSLFVNNSSIDSADVYYSTEEDGDYELLVTDGNVTVPTGSVYYYKVQLGDTYSNVVRCGSNFEMEFNVDEDEYYISSTGEIKDVPATVYYSETIDGKYINIGSTTLNSDSNYEIPYKYDFGYIKFKYSILNEDYVQLKEYLSDPIRFGTYYVDFEFKGFQDGKRIYSIKLPETYGFAGFKVYKSTNGVDYELYKDIYENTEFAGYVEVLVDENDSFYIVPFTEDIDGNKEEFDKSYELKVNDFENDFYIYESNNFRLEFSDNYDFLSCEDKKYTITIEESDNDTDFSAIADYENVTTDMLNEFDLNVPVGTTKYYRIVLSYNGEVVGNSNSIEVVGIDIYYEFNRDGFDENGEFMGDSNTGVYYRLNVYEQDEDSFDFELYVSDYLGGKSKDYYYSMTATKNDDGTYNVTSDDGKIKGIISYSKFNAKFPEDDFITELDITDLKITESNTKYFIVGNTYSFVKW